MVNACPSGKRGFDRRDIAQYALARTRRIDSRYKGKLYTCELCGMIHIGRKLKFIRKDERNQDAPLQPPA